MTKRESDIQKDKYRLECLLRERNEIMQQMRQEWLEIDKRIKTRTIRNIYNKNALGLMKRL